FVVDVAVPRPARAVLVLPGDRRLFLHRVVLATTGILIADQAGARVTRRAVHRVPLVGRGGPVHRHRLRAGHVLELVVGRVEALQDLDPRPVRLLPLRRGQAVPVLAGAGLDRLRQSGRDLVAALAIGHVIGGRLGAGGRVFLGNRRRLALRRRGALL